MECCTFIGISIEVITRRLRATYNATAEILCGACRVRCYVVRELSIYPNDNNTNREIRMQDLKERFFLFRTKTNNGRISETLCCTMFL